MKTMIKIALTFILITGLSASYAAAGDGITTVGGETLTIVSTVAARPPIDFVPSGNTLMAAESTSNGYYIGSASIKTTQDNGLEYCMVSGYNGHYQKTQSTDNDITEALTPDTDGTVEVPDDWTAMGGGAETAAPPSAD